MIRFRSMRESYGHHDGLRASHTLSEVVSCRSPRPPRYRSGPSSAPASLNIFIPSGGGQWAVQKPHRDLARRRLRQRICRRMAMAVAWGSLDQHTQTVLGRCWRLPA